MADNTYFVKRGWIIAKDGFGNMLPFFLHVRDKDIVWSDNEDFIYNKMRNKDISDITEIKPNVSLNFNSGIWNVDVNTDINLCTMRTALKFTPDIFTLNNSKDDLSTTLSLPLSLKDNRKLNIQCSIGTNSEDLAFSSANALKIYDNTTRLIHNLEVHVRNNTYKFPVDYYDRNAYKLGSLYISITGDFEITD